MESAAGSVRSPQDHRWRASGDCEEVEDAMREQNREGEEAKKPGEKKVRRKVEDVVEVKVIEDGSSLKLRYWGGRRHLSFAARDM
jgi:hypothetical protein